VLSRDLVATFVQVITGKIVFLPNDLRLLLARKWEHPESIIQGVEHAPKTYIFLDRPSAVLPLKKII
jgi:hypothetical protein